MKYAYINPYFKNNEEVNLDQSVTDDHLRYLKKISSVPYLNLDDSRKKKNVKFVSQKDVRRNSFSQNTSLTKMDIVDDNLKKKGKLTLTQMRIK